VGADASRRPHQEGAGEAPPEIDESLTPDESRRRKRQLLAHLVAWARARGGRFYARPDPTPAQVRAAAGPGSKVADWADAVERAAFSGEVVDEGRRAEIERLAPGAGERDPD
jgi:hypothetical protein